MFKPDENLKKKLIELNDNLKKQNDKQLSYNIRDIISKNIGDFKIIEKMSDKEINEWIKNQPIIIVDGSTNSYGNSFPYIISLFQAMAKCNVDINHEDIIIKSDILTPLYDKDREEILKEAENAKIPPDLVFSKKKSEILARLEVEVAIKAVKKFKPRLVIFDGGFLRYAGKCRDLWEEYKELALQNNVLSVGIIEEIGTHEIEKHLGNLLPNEFHGMFDRELLYGLLKEGEVLFLNDALRTKKDFYTCFARLSKDPQAIAFDFFGEQIKEAENIIKFSYRLTDVNSRGINILLDIVDEQTKISNEILDLYISTFISPNIKEKFLKPKRNKRIL